MRNLIRDMREQREWTRWELAVRAEVYPATIRNWEKGLTNPSVEDALRLAEVFGVTVEALFLREEVHSASLSTFRGGANAQVIDLIPYMNARQSAFRAHPSNPAAQVAR